MELPKPTFSRRLGKLKDLVTPAHTGVYYIQPECTMVLAGRKNRKDHKTHDTTERTYTVIQYERHETLVPTTVPLFAYLHIEAESYIIDIHLR